MTKYGFELVHMAALETEIVRIYNRAADHKRKGAAFEAAIHALNGGPRLNRFSLAVTREIQASIRENSGPEGAILRCAQKMQIHYAISTGYKDAADMMKRAIRAEKRLARGRVR